MPGGGGGAHGGFQGLDHIREIRNIGFQGLDCCMKGGLVEKVHLLVIKFIE